MNARTVRRAFGQYSALSHPLISWAQIALVAIGAMFWFMASQKVDAFNAQTFGEFALQFKAEAWATAMMGPAALVWIGLRNPVKRWMVIVGAALEIIQFCAIGYSAVYTGGEPVIGIYCIIFFAPLYAYTLGAAMNDT